MDPKQKLPGLYDPRFEHDNCGIGAVANIKGIKTHKTVDQALHIVENLEHRAGKDAEGKTGDGVGIMSRSPTVSSRKQLPRLVLPWEMRESTVLVCSFFHRMNLPENRP